jgi:hypothetical protein
MAGLESKKIIDNGIIVDIGIDADSGIDSDSEIDSDSGIDADDEMDTKSINGMIYNDVESVIDMEINVEENENKTLIVENKINYFNYYILNPFYYLYDCCKKLYFNFYAL